MSQGASAGDVVAPPPPGTSFYGGIGPAIVGVSWALCGVATIEIAIRIYTRFTIAKNAAGRSLSFAIVAWLIGVPSSILYTLAAVNGLGNHIGIAAFSPGLVNAILYEWIAACTISFAAWFGKLSPMFYVLEVQGNTYSAWRWILFVAVGVNLVSYIVTVPMIFTECVPAAKLWDAQLPGVCNGSERAFVWAIITGAWGALTDAVLALYPIALIWRLQIRRKLKVTLCALLGLGLFTAICSIVKTVQFGDLNAADDATYQIAPLMIWGVTEMWLVLIASSMAPIWPFVRRSSEYWSSHKLKYFSYASSRPSRRSEQEQHSKNLKGWRQVGKDESLDEYTVPEDGIMLTQNVHISSEAV